MDNDKSPEFTKCSGMMKKIVSDNNAVAQEKGLDVVIAFLENASTQIGARYVCHINPCLLFKKTENYMFEKSTLKIT